MAMGTRYTKKRNKEAHVPIEMMLMSKEGKEPEKRKERGTLRNRSLNRAVHLDQRSQVEAHLKRIKRRIKSLMVVQLLMEDAHMVKWILKQEPIPAVTALRRRKVVRCLR